jgi:hypothetical protein
MARTLTNLRIRLLIWFLQGVNILPGSFMTGDIRWAWNGAVAVAVGILLLVLVNRRRS